MASWAQRCSHGQNTCGFSFWALRSCLSRLCCASVSPLLMCCSYSVICLLQALGGIAAHNMLHVSLVCPRAAGVFMAYACSRISVLIPAGPREAFLEVTLKVCGAVRWQCHTCHSSSMLLLPTRLRLLSCWIGRLSSVTLCAAWRSLQHGLCYLASASSVSAECG